jgi:hypothetical protein
MPPSPNSKPNERDSRRTPRRVFKHPVGLLFEGKYQVVQAQQLSEGGVIFSGTASLKLKSQVVVSLCLPDGGVIVARGEISDIRAEKGKPLRHTLAFKPLSLQVRRSIRNYVTAKTQAEAEHEAARARSKIVVTSLRPACGCELKDGRLYERRFCRAKRPSSKPLQLCSCNLSRAWLPSFYRQQRSPYEVSFRKYEPDRA